MSAGVMSGLKFGLGCLLSLALAVLAVAVLFALRRYV